MSEYKRTVEDDLDWSLLNQLHSVVLQIGTFCFRTKQVCLTVLIAVLGIIRALDGESVQQSFFAAGILIPVVFWFLDSVGYFYQVKLRGIMDGVRDNIQKRHNDTGIVGINNEIIADERVSRSSLLRVIDSLFNHSMWLYPVLIAVSLVLWVFISDGVIT
jgi:hypothetical protein